MKILTARQMNEVDRRTSEEFGVPSLLLMENAGINLFMALAERFEDLLQKRIAIFCGKGNNGGDGLVLARQLAQRGTPPDVYLLGRGEEVRGDARVNLDIYRQAGWPLSEVPSEQEWAPVSGRLSGYEIVVDAILGTGISKPLEGFYLRVVRDLNAAENFVLAVDIPSGMVSDALLGGRETVFADLTVTFTAPKVAQVLNEDQDALGELHVVSIGTPPACLDSEEYWLNLMTGGQMRDALPQRLTYSHKGNFGHLAVVAGSRGKSGAAVLAATAALRAGAGLVTACTPDVVQPVVAQHRPEVMTEGLPSSAQGSFAFSALESLLGILGGKDAACLGPGLTTHSETVQLVQHLVRNSPVPLVMDADALNAFEGTVQGLRNLQGQALVLTPHPGEFSRLVDQPVSVIRERKLEISRDFAREQGLWLVLKGFRTLVADPSGRVFACPLGNPGMATAGTGDVLTGVLGAFIAGYCAQGRTSPEEITSAVNLGVYVHALAGDLAASAVGKTALISGDITAHLGAAFDEISGA
jgi:ADP-dependent NAD(P)H-hydrate dehydratase / NAD(P)H-hydrate epimerase